MIEVIVSGNNITSNKLFDTYYHIDKGYEIMTPKNDEVRKYCQFLKGYYLSSNKKQIIFIGFFL